MTTRKLSEFDPNDEQKQKRRKDKTTKGTALQCSDNKKTKQNLSGEVDERRGHSVKNSEKKKCKNIKAVNELFEEENSEREHLGGKGEKSKKKHKSSSEEETTTATKEVKYTAEYFGDKPAKPKKKKKKENAGSKKPSEELEGPSKKDAAIEYLKLWNTDRQKWKFQKLRQVWLLQHMYQVNKVPDDSFDILLLYLDGLKGKAREVTIAEAEKCLQSLEDEDEADNSESVKDPLKYNRARQLLQTLS